MTPDEVATAAALDGAPKPVAIAPDLHTLVLTA
jgi:hypothetical protein